MRIILILYGMLALMAGCQKGNNNLPENKSATELLTQKPWILTAHGFDDNLNDVLDSSENSIQDCQKDDSYNYQDNGTGVYSDNILSCGGNGSYSFNWQFLNNDTELKIGFEKFTFLRMNETDMILSSLTPGLITKYILVYRH